MDAVSDTAPPQAFTGRFSVAPMMDGTANAGKHK
jgi:hypothetical protein